MNNTYNHLMRNIKLFNSNLKILNCKLKKKNKKIIKVIVKKL